MPWFHTPYFTFLGLIVFCCAVEAVVVRYQKEFHNGIDGDEGGYISCNCGNGTERTTYLNTETAEALIHDEMSIQTCEKDCNQDVCNLLGFCRNCSLHLKRCVLPSKNEKVKSHCVKAVFYLRDGYFKIQESKVGQNLTMGEGSRVRRNVKTCGHPTNMKTADVACHSTPSLVKCTQLCIFGHTMKDGTVKKMQCHVRDNRWQPSGFSECQPFIDCTLSLVSPGSFDCFTATAKQAPICYVRCDHYEDKPSVPRRAYECQMDGSWSRSLPYCVNTGSGIAIVPRPHNLSKFPHDEAE